MKPKNAFPLFAMTAVLISCVPPKTITYCSSSGSEVDVMALYQIAWEQLFAQQAENYLVYIYSEACSNCQKIKSEVIAFVQEAIAPLFFVDIKNPNNHIPITYDIDSSYGATSYQDVSILGTPTIVEIFQGVLIANVAGGETCLTLLYEKRLNNGK